MNYRFIGILLIWVLGLPISSHAQNDTNLVVNPSFEEFVKCPDSLIHNLYGANLSELPNWWVASKGTADYYQKCSKPKRCGVPYNMHGYQPARTGDAYVGLIPYGAKISGKNYREYIQSKLIDTLTGGVEYYAEFYVSLAEISKFVGNSIGLYVSEKKIQGHSGGVIGYDTNSKMRMLELLTVDVTLPPDTFFKKAQLITSPVTPQVKSMEFLVDTINWIKVSGTFIAKGGEQYVTLGCFEKTIKRKRKGKNRKRIRIKGKTAKKKHRQMGFAYKLFKTAYYYIDDVLIRPLHPTKDTTTIVAVPTEPPTAPSLENQLLSEGKYVFRNLLFDTDKYDLRKQSYANLDSLVEFMNKYPKVKVEIAGHTDITGNAKYNLKLSKNRANAVKLFLQEKGIPANRINAKGYGITLPVATNNTVEGRQLNRRVEVIVVN